MVDHHIVDDASYFIKKAEECFAHAHADHKKADRFTATAYEFLAEAVKIETRLQYEKWHKSRQPGQASNSLA